MDYACLLTIFTFILLAFLILAYCYYDVAIKLYLPSLEGKHVVVTGGSSGIGKCVAKEAAKLGANVTVIARNQEKLNDSITEILGSCQNKNQKITALSMDVTQSYELTESKIITLENLNGPIFMFVNCAGSAECAIIENASESNFRRMIDLNIIGTIFPTKAAAKQMIKRRSGIIIITSSLASLLGIYGLGAYCTSKWALRGFGETLRQEMTPHNISVTMCLPPDTDTPGFEQENKDKPEETKIICNSGGIMTPDEVAQKLISDAMRGRFWSTVGFDSNILCFGSAGFSPYSSLTEIILQVSLASITRLVGILQVNKIDSIISLCKAKRDLEKHTKND